MRSSRTSRRVVLLVLVALLTGGLGVPASAATRRSASPRPVRLLAEKDVSLDQSLRLARLLRERGVEVALTRTSDVFVPLRERTGLAAAAGADLFVSVHNNASTSRSARGTEVYSQLRSRAGAALAHRILDAVTARTGTRPRGVFQRPGRDGDYYAVLRTAAMPAVIVELAFLSNPDEARALASPTFRQMGAEGMAAGILAHLATRPARPALAPPRRTPAGPVVQPPAGLTAAVARPDVTLRWPAVAGAIEYRVWRDGEAIARLSALDASTAAGALPPELTVTDRHVPGGEHRYEVRALVETGGQVVDESESATTLATMPWVVTVDPGHGGHDPGAVGRF
jgi:N-acetylmuramoyl-L-alanine amidase